MLALRDFLSPPSVQVYYSINKSDQMTLSGYQFSTAFARFGLTFSFLRPMFMGTNKQYSVSRYLIPHARLQALDHITTNPG